MIHAVVLLYGFAKAKTSMLKLDSRQTERLGMVIQVRMQRGCARCAGGVLGGLQKETLTNDCWMAKGYAKHDYGLAYLPGAGALKNQY